MDIVTENMSLPDLELYQDQFDIVKQLMEITKRLEDSPDGIDMGFEASMVLMGAINRVVRSIPVIEKQNTPPDSNVPDERTVASLGVVVERARQQLKRHNLSFPKEILTHGKYLVALENALHTDEMEMTQEENNAYLAAVLSAVLDIDCLLCACAESPMWGFKYEAEAQAFAEEASCIVGGSYLVLGELSEKAQVFMEHQCIVEGDLPFAMWKMLADAESDADGVNLEALARVVVTAESAAVEGHVWPNSTGHWFMPKPVEGSNIVWSAVDDDGNPPSVVHVSYAEGTSEMSDTVKRGLRAWVKDVEASGKPVPRFVSPDGEDIKI